MKRSSDRILTTHVGSLARPHDLLELISDKLQRRPHDEGGLSKRVKEAVGEIVRQQAEHGIDVVSDGEQGKAGFSAYIGARLDGFEAGERHIDGNMMGRSREADAFPEYYERYFKRRADARLRNLEALVCTGPIVYKGQTELQTDIENLKAALAGVAVEDAFMPATAPRAAGPNHHYATEEEYALAFADAVREEYKAIIEAGLVLQIDDPRLTNLYQDADLTPQQSRAEAERYVDVINYAIRDLPPDQIRFHTCYGINEGPRVHDAPMAEYIDVMFRINAGAFSFEAGNPRHDHEWHLFEDYEPPEGKILIPGVISHTTNVVEHEELIAERIVRYAKLVGRENVIAGADCGFSSNATFIPDVDPRVVWAKFEALAEGARIASKQLW